MTEGKINIIVLGNFSVGKTCFILRYTNNVYNQIHLSTIGIDFKTKDVILPNKQSYKILYYDTAGEERYRSLSLNSIKNADGIILLYDITNIGSFESIQNWMSGINELKGKNFPAILIGNKCDLNEDRVISYSKGKELAQSLGINFYETSSKDNINIEESNLDVINKIIEYRDKKKNNKDKKSIRLNKSKVKKKRKCC